MGRRFALDSNILIHCHRQIYPFEIAPAFWRQLIENGQRIVLINKVKDEILRNQDELSKWLKKNEKRFVTKEAGESTVISCYSEIITSVKQNTQYKETAKDEFARTADSWLCAYGMAYGDVLVTNEKYEPAIRKRIKIPNICHEFNIKYILVRVYARVGYQV